MTLYLAEFKTVQGTCVSESKYRLIEAESLGIAREKLKAVLGSTRIYQDHIYIHPVIR